MPRPAPAQASSPVAARAAAVAAVAAGQFICPLLFFTDLTRNPYFTQIALVNVFAAVAGACVVWDALATGRWRLPRTPADLPWAAWIAACALSWAVAYAGHREFFRPSIASEGTRAFAFLLANSLLPFLLALNLPADRAEETPGGWEPWAFFGVVWGGAWALFPSLRAPVGSEAVWEHLWDPFGGMLWVAGVAAVLWLCRRGRFQDFWHLFLTAAALASAYAVLQYFSVEWIWPKALNPYGGRSVSTFGNPNFMSTHVVLLLPVAAALYVRASGVGARLFYGACFLLFEAALLCSLTRSSWIGAAAAMGVLLLHPEAPRRLREDRAAVYALVFPALLLVLFWPQSVVESYNPSVLGRLAEVMQAWSGPAVPAAASGGPAPAIYGPWHQRLLIWTCAWQIGLDNPWTGKGWGLFELFYPYFQGPLVLSWESFRVLRTHANNCHNEVLEVFSQTGLLGLGVFVWLWTAATAGAWRLRAARGGLWRWAAFAGVAGAMADNLLNVSIHFAVPGFLFWWQAGTAIAPEAGESSERRWQPETAGARTAAAVAAAAALLCASWWGRQWMREVDYFSGFKLMRQAGPAAAAKRLERAHAWHSREVNTNYELGNAYARAGDPEKALWGYEEALRANAGYDEIFYNKASVLANRLGRAADAEAAYRTAMHINPLNKDTYVGLANLYLKDPARHAAAAEAVLAQATRVFPWDMNFRTNLGFFRTQRGDHAGAYAAFRDVLKLDPDSDLAQRNFKLALGRLGRTTDPLLDALVRLGDLEARVRRNEFGEPTLKLAEGLAGDFPDSVKVRLFLGNLYLLNGKDGPAERELLRVLAREPDHVPARKNLAVLYERGGRLKDAAAAYREVLRAAPADKEARDALVRLGAPHP